MRYFVEEVGFAPVGPMSAKSTIQFIQYSKTLLGKLPIRDMSGRLISLQLLCNRAHDEETSALRPIR